MIRSADITGLVLAGGQGRRMGGADKGLLELAGRPLAWHALQRLAPQVGRCLISANRHLAAYRALGAPVCLDAVLAPHEDAARQTWRTAPPPEDEGRPRDERRYAGPLAGLHAGLSHCTTPWLLVVPCDAPGFPLDLGERLASALATAAAAEGAGGDTQGLPARRMAVAWARGGTEPLAPQPVFCLMHRSLRGPLADFLGRGGRRALDWAAQAGALRVDFDRPGLDTNAFRNLNTPADLQALADRA